LAQQLPKGQKKLILFAMNKHKIYSLIVLLLTISVAANAQRSNAIIFTENGEKFTVILNGLRQNENPETNVKIEGLNANFYKMKVLFDNTALGESNFNLHIEPGSETTYVIKKNNKNVYVLRPMSMVPIAEAPPTPQSSQVVTYNPSAPVYVPAETVTQQTTTTTTTGTPSGSGVSMGVNIGDAGGNFSMNVSGFDNMGTTTTQQTTISTTTTTTTSAPVYDNVPVTPAPVVYLPGYGGPIGCPIPMEHSEFASMKKSI